MEKKFTHGSLFSGIGGFDFAAKQMQWENVFHCEINPFGRKVLDYYYPNAISYEDITKTDFSVHRGTIDVLTGGFPCQPFSLAGKRKGTEDSRHLWPEMLRAIQEIQPKWIVGENVFGIINWDGGVVFNQVQIDLEAEGYEVQPYVLPACAVNAPHRRDRVWFVAKNTKRNRCIQREFEQEGTEIREQRNISTGSSNGIYVPERNVTNSIGRGLEGATKVGWNSQYVVGESITGITTNTINSGSGNELRNFREWEKTDEGWRGQPQPEFGEVSSEWDASNTSSNGCNQCNSNDEKYTSEGGEYAFNDTNKDVMHTNSTSKQGEYIKQSWERKFDRSDSRNGVNNFQNFPTQSPVCSRNDGLSTRLFGITFPKHRNESIKAYGNAVVPQVVLQIFKAIEQYEKIYN